MNIVNGKAHRQNGILEHGPALRLPVELTPSPGLPRDWLLWQLADSAFPTGGFAHSGGLESAWHHRAVCNGRELVSYVQASLHQVGRSSLPFVTAAHVAPEQLPEVDRYCEAFTTNHVANRASRLQGRAILAVVGRVFVPGNSRGAARGGEEEVGPDVRGGGAAKAALALSPPFGHLAPVFGAVTEFLELDKMTALRLFIFSHVRSLIAAAIRLNIVGPIEAQRIQRELSSSAENIVISCASLDLDDLAQTAPLLDLWQGTHDRLYSRLFQS